MVDGHVVEARPRLPASRAHLIERDAVEADLFGRVSSGRDEALHRILLVLVEPPRHGLALGAGCLAIPAAVEHGLTGRREHYARAHVLIAGREAARPDVGRFDDVVVEADDPRDLAHLGVSPAIVVRCRARSWPSVSPITACCTQRLSQIMRSPTSHRCRHVYSKRANCAYRYASNGA